MSPHVHLPTVRRAIKYSVVSTPCRSQSITPELNHLSSQWLDHTLLCWDYSWFWLQLLSWINCDARLWHMQFHWSGWSGPHFHNKTSQATFFFLFFFPNTSLFGGFKKGSKNVWNPAAFSMLMQIIASLRHCISWFYCVSWCNEFILLHLSWLIGE